MIHFCMHSTQALEKMHLLDFDLFSPKWDVFIRLLMSKYRDLCGRRTRKIKRTRGCGYAQENSLPYTTGYINIWDCDSMYKTFTGASKPDKIPEVGKVYGHKVL